MRPVEIIYSGYLEEHENNIDTPETNAAADAVMELLESLLPNSRIQDAIFAECLHFAGLSQKQGFEAGFTFALEVMRCREARKQ